MYRRSYIQKVLCSEGPMFRKYLFRRSFVQMVSYSKDPMFRKSYVQKKLFYMFRRSYIQKYLFGRFYIQKVLCWEDPIFRRSFVQKVLCWNTFPSFGYRYKNISRFFFITFMTLLFTSSKDTRDWVPKLRRFRNFKFRKPKSQVPGTWKPRTQVSKFCRHAWRFALCLFCNLLIYIWVFLQWYLITLLQLNFRLKSAIYCAASCVTNCAASLRRILCRLFLYTS